MRIKIARKIASTDKTRVNNEKGKGSKRRGFGKARLTTIQPAIESTFSQTNVIEPLKFVIASASRSPAVALRCSAASSANTRSTLRRVNSSAEREVGSFSEVGEPFDRSSGAPVISHLPSSSSVINAANCQ